VATTHITKGTRILSQKPIFSFDMVVPISRCFEDFQSPDELLDTLRSLGAPLLKQYLELHGYAPPILVKYFENENNQKWNDVLPFCKQVMAIFWVNHREGRLFLRGSRMNHSCVPNVYDSFNLNSGEGIFHAIRDIQSGEELTRSYYVHEKDWYLEGRRPYLRSRYGFVCMCDACIDTPGARLADQVWTDRIMPGKFLLYDQEHPRPETPTDWVKCREIAKDISLNTGHMPDQRMT
jgi:hypothetical protein